ERVLEELDARRARGEYVAAAHYVFAHIKRGNLEDAFAVLPKMAEEPDWFALQIRVNPILDPLIRSTNFITPAMKKIRPSTRRAKRIAHARFRFSFIFSKLSLLAAGRVRQKQIRQRYHEGVPSACLHAASA
ncbi:MAG: hypothetical protein WCB20_07405, partial [Chthoniobacterales bacterium]